LKQTQHVQKVITIKKLTPLTILKH